jgi:hypothetical protein
MSTLFAVGMVLMTRMQGAENSGAGGGGGGGFLQLAAQSCSVALAPGVPDGTGRHCRVLRSHKCGQCAAGGGLLVGQPAMDVMFTL